jgi:hypothetical protein
MGAASSINMLVLVGFSYLKSSKKILRSGLFVSGIKLSIQWWIGRQSMVFSTRNYLSNLSKSSKSKNVDTVNFGY